MFAINSKAFEVFDTDRMSVYRREIVEDEDGSLIESDPKPIYINLPCHCSISTTDQPIDNTHNTSPINEILQVDFAASYDVKKNDYLVIKRFDGNSVMGEYRGNVSNLDLYPSRKRALVMMDVNA